MGQTVCISHYYISVWRLLPFLWSSAKSNQKFHLFCWGKGWVDPELKRHSPYTSGWAACGISWRATYIHQWPDSAGELNDNILNRFLKLEHWTNLILPPPHFVCSGTQLFKGTCNHCISLDKLIRFPRLPLIICFWNYYFPMRVSLSKYEEKKNPSTFQREQTFWVMPNWNSKQTKRNRGSIDGRAQLISSVLCSMQVYCVAVSCLLSVKRWLRRLRET